MACPGLVAPFDWFGELWAKVAGKEAEKRGRFHIIKGVGAAVGVLWGLDTHWRLWNQDAIRTEFEEDHVGGRDCGWGNWGRQMWREWVCWDLVQLCSLCTRPGCWLKKWVGLKHSPSPAFLAVDYISSEERAPF